MSYYDEESKAKVVPYVASEPSQGVDRAFMAFMFDAYNLDEKRDNVVLKLHPELAPIKLGVFPLVNKLEGKAKEIFDSLKAEFVSTYDRSGSIGRRYARADEIGVPYCITIDFDTLNDNAVTLRNRDDARQVRIAINDLKEKIGMLISRKIKFEDAGKLIA